MIGTDTFNKSFDRLCASFNKPVTSANRDIWHQEVRECDYKPFVRAMGMLTNAQYWPKFGDFHSAYGTFRDMDAGVIDYCGNCLNGQVVVELKDDMTASNPCSICYPKHPYGVDPKGLTLKWVENPVAYNSSKKLTSPKDALAKIKWLRGWLERMQWHRDNKAKAEARARLKGQEGFGEETEYQSEKHRMART